MKEDGNGVSEDVGRQSAFSRAIHSIRTRYSLATAGFLLACLTIFYIGGRIVLVHLMREAEQQVREIGYDISRLAYRHADAVRRAHAESAAAFVRALSEGKTAVQALGAGEGGDVSLLGDVTAEGVFVSGAVRVDGKVEELSELDVAPYAVRIREWCQTLASPEEPGASVGIVQLRGGAHYIFLSPYGEGESRRVLVLGTAFDSSVFTSRVNEGFSGLDVKVVNRKVAVTVAAPHAPRSSGGGGEFGLAPMLSEAINFYSGGFWNLGSTPFEAVFAVRDIAGNAVSMISVSLPSSLATVTRSALGRLTFFIAMAGIILVLPIFWFQGRVLLNPLTKMTEAIRRLGEHHADIDCPTLEWKGKDEFAMLALSVNRMLETLSERAVTVAQVEARHRALIAGVPDALAVFDRRGRLVSVTKEAEGVAPIPGLEVGETPSESVYGAKGAEAFVRALLSVFDSASSAAPLHLVDEADGRDFEVRIARMDEVFALAIIRDVTKEAAEHRLRLAAEARAVDASKRESLTMLAAGIAHDMNNVLSIILSSVEGAAASDEDGKNETAVIRDAVMRGKRMTKELMEFAGDSKISLVRAAPGFFIHDVQPLVARVIGKNVALFCRLADDAPDVDADPNQFWKVFFNIVKNAGEALGERPGNIVLSTEAFEMTEEIAAGFISEGPLPCGPGVLFCVSDDGPGVPPELLPRLFDPYVSSKSLGRGLGLATVRTIVEAHGGGLRVESEPDHGTTFKIFLPKSRLPESAAAGSTPGRAKSGALPAQVLVVDDDAAILKMVSMLLKSLKIDAQTACDRRTALGILRRHAGEIGAVLLDAHLGGVDVVRLYDAFKVAAPDIPVIIVSGSLEDAIRRMFRGRAFDGFLGKPFTLEELKDVLASLPPRATS